MYFGDSAATVWAEWYRALAELEVPPTAQMPRELWRWTISLDGLADLSTEAQLARVALGTPRPGHDTWPGMVLCIFRVATELMGADPLRPPEVFDEPPPPPTGMTT